MFALTFLGQEIAWHDVGVVALLILLEGVLSIDNALVLGLLAKRLPKHQQRRALTYGLIGAFVFRFLAIGTAAFLLEWRVVKLLGGGYLAYVAVKHLFFEAREHIDAEVIMSEEGEPTLVGAEGKPLTREELAHEIEERVPIPLPDERLRRPLASFWPTVAVIELTDIAFAVDSILAAIALVGSPPPGHEGVHPKLWVIITGGILGVILMRFAAVIFIQLLDRFPRFETAAYLLVAVIGAKLLLDWGFNTHEHHRLDFHDWRHPAFWTFWIVMIVCFLVGFLPQKNKSNKSAALQAIESGSGVR